MSARNFIIVLVVVLFAGTGVAYAHTLSTAKADAAIEKAIAHNPNIKEPQDVQAYSCNRITAHRVKCKIDFGIEGGSTQCTGTGVAYYPSKHKRKVKVKLSYHSYTSSPC